MQPIKGFNATYIETEDIHLQRRLEEGLLQRSIREWANARYESKNKQVPFIPPAIRETIKQNIQRTLKKIHDKKSKKFNISSPKKISKNKQIYGSSPRFTFREEGKKEDICITINPPKEQIIIPKNFKLKSTSTLNHTDQEEVRLKLSRQSKKMSNNTSKTPRVGKIHQLGNRLINNHNGASRKITITSEDFMPSGETPHQNTSLPSQSKSSIRKSVTKQNSRKACKGYGQKNSAKNILPANRLLAYDTIPIGKMMEGEIFSSTTSKDCLGPQKGPMKMYTTLRGNHAASLPDLKGVELGSKASRSNVNLHSTMRKLQSQKSTSSRVKQFPTNEKTKKMALFRKRLANSKTGIVTKGPKPKFEKSKKMIQTPRSALDMKSAISSPAPTISTVKFRRRMRVEMKECNDDQEKMDGENTNEVAFTLQRQNTKILKNKLENLSSKKFSSTKEQPTFRGYEKDDIIEEDSDQSSFVTSLSSSEPEAPTPSPLKASNKMSTSIDLSNKKRSSKTARPKRANLGRIIQSCEDLLHSDTENYTEILKIRKYMNLVNRYFKDKVEYLSYFNNEIIE
ncbi:unnamed protein product [Moneuplotes crassus]|uniref:Uncharacterized protein n=1 Tax=Euplotes crassus TaxID=5936 RepID=A0AAD1UD92_EUPCR|nr:unnamed protein product [Moneuplotes crassus]